MGSGLKLKISKGDTVQVISGAEKGKKGQVLALAKSPLRIKVQGVRMQTHCDKEEGQVNREGFIDYSNVKLIEKSKKVSGSKKKVLVKP